MKLRLVGTFILTLIAAPVNAIDPAPMLVVSIHPLALLLEEVLDTDATLTVLVSPSDSGHHFNLKPSGMRALRSAQQVFWLGPSLEQPLAHIFETYPDINQRALLPSAASPDPHVWLDPQQALALLARMMDSLAEAGIPFSPAGRDRIVAELEALDIELARRLAPVSDTPFVALHNAWGHYVRHFGLRQLATLPGHDDQGASARAVSELRKKARDGGARCLIAEPAGAYRLAQSVVRGTDIQIVELDPMGLKQPRQAGGYAAMMRRITADLVNCLSR